MPARKPPPIAPKPPRTRTRGAARAESDAQRLVKISALAELAGVPIATIKHYLREGLIVPARSGRNMAYYAIDNVERIRRIKGLQANGHLPLKIIRELLDKPASEVETIEATILGALGGVSTSARRTRKELLLAGVSSAELEWLKASGAIQAVPDVAEESYGGDDLELLRTLGAAREAGLTADMLPLSIVAQYVDAIRNLVTVELTLFREGVVPKAQTRLPEVTHAATMLSEKLVVLLRRKLLIPVLRTMSGASDTAEGRGRRREAP